MNYDVNLELYRVFYIVAKNESISKASTELLISQPAISKSIKKLEDYMNCTLFIRNKKGVLLTYEGRILYNYIEQAMELIYCGENKVKEIVNLEYGYLSIGASKTIVQNFLMPYLKYFNETYPNIKIDIHTDRNDVLITKARNGIIDFIILNMPYECPNDFNVTKLRELHDCFIACNKFKNLLNRKIEFDELDKYPVILPAKGGSTRMAFDDFCFLNNFNFSKKIELTSTSLVISFAMSGMGIGYATREFLSDDNGLFLLDTTFELPVRSLALLSLKDKKFNNISEMFIRKIL